MNQRKRKLAEEINFLDSLVEEMKEDIEDMKYTQKVEAASRTTMGRVNLFTGVFFSFILLMRLYSAFTAIMHQWNQDQSATEDYQPPRKRDSVTSLVLWLWGHHMVTEKDFAQVSQFISLFLTALLSFSQVRAFLRTLGAIHRRLSHLCCVSSAVTTGSRNIRQSPRSGNSDLSPSNAGNDENRSIPAHATGLLHMHALAALMGSYFMACLILAKMMVPWEYRASFSGALGGFDAFAIQSDLITILYTFSAVVSTTVLALLFGIQKQNSLRHSVSWTDDVGISKSPEV